MNYFGQLYQYISEWRNRVDPVDPYYGSYYGLTSSIRSPTLCAEISVIMLNDVFSVAIADPTTRVRTIRNVKYKITNEDEEWVYIAILENEATTGLELWFLKRESGTSMIGDLESPDSTLALLADIQKIGGILRGMSHDLVIPTVLGRKYEHPANFIKPETYKKMPRLYKFWLERLALALPKIERQ